MESRNIEIVEGYFASLDHGQEVIAARDDPEWLGEREREASELLHPEFEMHFAAPGGTPETYSGADRFAEAGTAWLEPWREYRTHLEEAIPLGDHVVVVSRAWAVPSEGGEPVERLITFLWTFTDGRVTRMEHFRDKEEALEAARAHERPLEANA